LIFSFVAGAALGGLGVGLFTHFTGKEKPLAAQPTVRVIQGTPVTHSDFKQDKKTFSFTTTSMGPGISRTTINKRDIPEAKAYMDRVHAIQGMVGYGYDGTSTGLVSLGVMYHYRLENLSLGIGVLGNMKSISALASVTYWF